MYAGALPLGPDEIELLPVLKVTSRPPEAILQAVTNQVRVVALAHIVFVRRKRQLWEDNGQTVLKIQFIKEFLVIAFLEFIVLILVFGVL